MKIGPDLDTFFGDFRWHGDAVEDPDEREISAAIRDYLQEVRAQLFAWHGEGASGKDINEANSDCMDRLIRRFFQMAEEEYYAGAFEFRQRLAVVAVGGYGRRELCIHSDIDLLFLYEGEIDDYVKKLAERLQVRLWDGKLEVGCALRSIEETLEIGLEDMTARTAILNARFITGDADLFHKFLDQVRSTFRANDPVFIEALSQSMKERHQKYGESLFRLQPNVKEGVGGLRDYHLAQWVVLSRHSSLSLRGLIDLLDYGLLSESELDAFRTALRFIWRVRATLHFLCKRKNDQLNFDLQERLADELGYGTPSEEVGFRPVERFMQDYYRHARVIQNCSMAIIDQCMPRKPKSEQEHRELGEGFVLVDGELEIPHDSLLRDQPLRFMRVFEIAACENVPISQTAQRLLRESLPHFPDSFPSDPKAAESFLKMLDNREGVTNTLLTMNETGVLGRFLPEWEHIVCLWQHVIYHTYTVDIHTIFLVSELERLYRGASEWVRPEYSDMMHQVEDRVVLYLGCIFHDIGKGLGGKHAERSSQMAATACRRLGLSEDRVKRVCFLARHHLQMSHIAQRRDLSDPSAIEFFTKLVGDYTNLLNLYLLTFADFRASSAQAWTDWTAGLLRELFVRTTEILECGELDSGVTARKLDSRADRLRDSARAQLAGMGVNEELIDSFCSRMPQRYFLTHTSWQIARQAMVMLAFREKDAISCGIREMRGGFTEFIVCAKDSYGLYSNIAGCLTFSGINILGSHIHTTRDGMALEVYRVATPEGDASEKRKVWHDVQDVMRSVLTGEMDLSKIKMRRTSPYTSSRSKARPRYQKASVRVSNTESDFFTIIDISAYDRLGLLYQLTSKIFEYELEIQISKASTRLDQVADTFYLKTREGGKVQDEELLERLRQDLLKVAEEGDRESKA
ncbi:MAG: [protein-PII] uridylyltransferase [Deltaproteobacteria bacterium]|nr:[protein-PII] uridylyltransferase [Deltaproteobacteria bacterium]